MENKNEVIGFIRDFDKLGRIVIPKELREFFKLSSVEIVPTTEGILLRNPKYKVVKIED